MGRAPRCGSGQGCCSGTAGTGADAEPELGQELELEQELGQEQERERAAVVWTVTGLPPSLPVLYPGPLPPLPLCICVDGTRRRHHLAPSPGGWGPAAGRHATCEAATGEGAGPGRVGPTATQ